MEKEIICPCCGNKILVLCDSDDIKVVGVFSDDERIVARELSEKYGIEFGVMEGGENV